MTAKAGFAGCEVAGGNLSAVVGIHQFVEYVSAATAHFPGWLREFRPT